MTRILALLILSASFAMAETAAEQIKTRFSEVIRSELKSMMEAQLAKQPSTPQTESYRQNIDSEVAKIVPQAFSAFKPELELSEADATELLKNGPHDAKNKAKIQENQDLFQKSPLPKPVLVTSMLTHMDADPAFSGWNLEILRRLTDGTVRQLKERGELK